MNTGRPKRTSNKVSVQSRLTKLAIFPNLELNSDSVDDSKHSNISLNRLRTNQSIKNDLTHARKEKLSAYCNSESDLSDNEIMEAQVNKQKSSKVVFRTQKTPRKGKLVSASVDVENVTPPKQPKCEECPEKASSKSFSPSSLFSELELNSPRKSFVAKKSIYESARKALYSNVPRTMPGREHEYRQLVEFITNHVGKGTSGSMYISGPPGTGKTATLSMILQRDEMCKMLKAVYINCTGIKSPGAVYSKIVMELGIKTSGRSEKEYVAAITKYLTKSSNTVLVVLDEIDQLNQLNGHQRTLYTLFSLPSSYPLLLIGIANALDLTDRLLPRLQSLCSTDVKPQLLHFAPYTRLQIIKIFTERLKEAFGDRGIEVFDDAMLGMLASKFSAMSGDVRKALDMGRRVVEILERSQAAQDTSNTTVLKSIENGLCSNSLAPKATSKIVNLLQVNKALNTIYGTSFNLSNESDSGTTFPLQQKIIICSLLLHMKYGQSKDITMGKLHEIYNRICSKRNIVAVDQAEFYALLGLVETRGIIRVFGKKERRLHKVSLEWDEDEVEQALRDKEMISSIMRDDSCLKRT